MKKILKSFFWGNWAQKVIQLILIFNCILSVLIAAHYTRIIVAEKAEELAILIIIPIFLFMIFSIINFAFIFAIRSIRNNWDAFSGKAVIAISIFLGCFFPGLATLVINLFGSK